MAIVSAVSGIFIAEGFSCFIKNDHCPEKVKDLSNTLIDPLKSLPLAYLICGTLATIFLTQGSLTLSTKALKGRVRFIPAVSQQMAAALGVYRLSIPLLLGMTVYLSRRDNLEVLIANVGSLIDLAREAGSSLSNLLLDSDELVAKVEKEIQEGLDGISASIRYIVFANEPRVIRTISKEISDFEDHLRNLSRKMPAFERKLEAARKLLLDSKSHLINQIREIESESDRIDQILQEIQKEHVSFWEEKFKSFLDKETLIGQKQTLNEKLAHLKELSNTIDLITSGISLVYQSDVEEIKAIRRWNIYIKYTPLPVLEDAFCLRDSF
jgi:predicted  nucleic acid-binding Zn-ribbon protein